MRHGQDLDGTSRRYRQGSAIIDALGCGSSHSTKPRQTAVRYHSEAGDAAEYVTAAGVGPSHETVTIFRTWSFFRCSAPLFIAECRHNAILCMAKGKTKER